MDNEDVKNRASTGIEAIERLSQYNDSGTKASRVIMKRAMPIPPESMTLMDEVRQLDGKGCTDDALDLLFNAIEEMMWNNRFPELDSLIAGLEANKYSVDTLLGLLTATLPARSRLPSRPKFYNDVEVVLDRRDELENGLLAGLE